MKIAKTIKGDGNVYRFYNWLVMCENIHLDKHDRVARAFRIVAIYQPNQNIKLK